MPQARRPPDDHGDGAAEVSGSRAERLARLRERLPGTGRRRPFPAQDGRARQRVSAAVRRARRLAHRLHRLRRPGRRAGREGGRLPPTAATPSSSPRRSTARSSSAGTSSPTRPSKWLEANLPEGGRLGYDPVPGQARRAGAPREGGGGAGAAASSRSTPTRSTRSGPTGRRAPRAGSSGWTTATPARAAPPSGRGSATRSGPRGGLAAADRCRLRRLAAQRPRQRHPLQPRSASASRSLRATRPAAGSSTARKLPSAARPRQRAWRSSRSTVSSTRSTSSGGAGKTSGRPAGRPISATSSGCRRPGPGWSRPTIRCLLPKACKNPVEIEGARRRPRRDGAAVARFLAWLDREAPDGGLDEIGAAERLLADCAQDTGCSRRVASTPSPAHGPNGAIAALPRRRRATNRPLDRRHALPRRLRAASTSTARPTSPAPWPSASPRPRCASASRWCSRATSRIATARFPDGTSGSQLDTLARTPLWQRRPRLRPRHRPRRRRLSVASTRGRSASPSCGDNVALEPGMIVSNEPGYYKLDAYGIRIENLVTVEKRPKPEGGERELLGFETLTLCPIDRRLIDVDLLTADERAWSTPTTRASRPSWAGSRARRPAGWPRLARRSRDGRGRAPTSRPARPRSGARASPSSPPASRPSRCSTACSR